MSSNPDDEKLLRRWEHFRANYASLGFRKATYEYFVFWQEREYQDQVEHDEARRRIHATRKRHRLANRKRQSDSPEL